MSEDAQAPGGPDDEARDRRPEDVAPDAKVSLGKPHVEPHVEPPVEPLAGPNPWAPPTDARPSHGVGESAGGPVPSSAHDRQTATSFPGAPHPYAAPGAYAVPPPPIAPGGPGQVPYGYGYGHGPGPAHGHGHGYGYPAYPVQGGPGYGWPGMPTGPSNGLGTASLVLGIVAAVGFCLWPVALVCGILALVFGGIGRARARRGQATNAGHALAGIICGAVGVALGIAFLVVFLVLPDSEIDDSGTGGDGFSTSLTAVG
ncbi:DUF4190 domain-containing protein [Streptomyces sp. NPDC087844]|uniref:DUF4190 domain-containing protein n=1 Tax=Streptomyces sp. NPDC087844 TaxID=3365805 RepID=UPI00380C200F